MEFPHLFIAIAAEITATSMLKHSDGFTRLAPSLVIILGYTMSFYFLSLAVRIIPVSIAYAIWCGAGMIGIYLTGILFYKQFIDAPAVVGITLIILGIIVINIFSKSTSI